MPLTAKGKKIMSHMKDEYGAKKGKEVFYASQNKGTIKGTHEKGAADDLYAKGFCEKCAALGIDPEVLMKQAGLADILAKLRPSTMLHGVGKGLVGAGKHVGKFEKAIAKAPGNVGGFLAKDLARTGKDIAGVAAGGKALAGRAGSAVAGAARSAGGGIADLASKLNPVSAIGRAKDRLVSDIASKVNVKAPAASLIKGQASSVRGSVNRAAQNIMKEIQSGNMSLEEGQKALSKMMGEGFRGVNEGLGGLSENVGRGMGELSSQVGNVGSQVGKGFEGMGSQLGDLAEQNKWLRRGLYGLGGMEAADLATDAYGNKKAATYAAGFIEKCASAGVDPEALVKQAYGEEGLSKTKAYGLGLLPGAPIWQSIAAPAGRKLKTLGMSLGGGIAGGMGGGLAGVLLSALSKGRLNPGVMNMLGSGIGGYMGSGMGARSGSAPTGMLESLIAKIRGKVGG